MITTVPHLYYDLTLFRNNIRRIGRIDIRYLINVVAIRNALIDY